LPVTAKLSRRFYDRLGDEIANELVDWFNKVDAAYRSDLKEINELNFARFDAKLEQRLAQLETRFAQFEAKQEERFSAFRDDLNGRMQKLALEAADGRTAHTRWMFVAWTTLLIPIIGLYTR
jgi:predicted nuclease of restriction endonuclease-like RecB superfamily